MPRHNRRFVPAFLKGPGSVPDQPAMFERPMEERCQAVVRLKALVEELLGKRLRQTASEQGGYSYDPCGLFLVLMFGYMQGQRSSRRLEEACKFDRRYEYLSEGLEPDHATLARFRRRTESELEDLFLLVCQEAESRGILERRAMVVDGTKVAAARTQWRKALVEAEAADGWEDEARTMLARKENQFLVGYNLQVAADASSGMIVGYVATNLENDQRQMPAVVEATHRQSGALPEKAVADKGYDSRRDVIVDASDPVPFMMHRGLFMTVKSLGEYRFLAPVFGPDETISDYRAVADNSRVKNDNVVPLDLPYVESQFDYYRGERVPGGILAKSPTVAGLERSRMFFEQSLSESSGNPLSLAMLAQTARALGKHAEAKHLFERALKLYSHYGWVPDAVRRGAKE